MSGLMIMMKRKTTGFTLIEMMIVVAVIAILASLAVPSYQRYVQQSRRAEALNAVQRVAALEEQFYFARGAYTANAANEIGAISPTPGGDYTIAVAVVANPASFIVTATPAVGGKQVSDTECATFTLTNTGVQGATGSTGDQANCWKH